MTDELLADAFRGADYLGLDWIPPHWLPYRGEYDDETEPYLRPPGPARVLILEENPLMGALFARILKRDPDIAIVAVTHTAEAALHGIREHAPEVMLCQMGAAAREDFRLCELLRDAGSPVALLVIAADDEVWHWREAYVQGVRGWIHRHAVGEMLPSAVHGIVRQGSWIGPAGMAAFYGRDDTLAEYIETLEAQLAENREPLSRLTRTEKETLTDLVAGLTDEQIRRRRGVSLSTVKTHVRHILRKLAVGHRREAAALAQKLGFLRP
jgi:DNA-binding NarL/FixJ family response regulator